MRRDVVSTINKINYQSQCELHSTVVFRCSYLRKKKKVAF